MQMHSLRPHTMVAHVAIYPGNIHHSVNSVPKSFLETLDVRVSILNRCSSCLEHHFAGLQRLLLDDNKAVQIRAGLEALLISACEPVAKDHVAMAYARKLNAAPSAIAPRIC